MCLLMERMKEKKILSVQMKQSGLVSLSTEEEE